MSMRCEDVRPLLAPLVYEELDAATAEAVHEHLGGCLSCKRRHVAFGAVRQDLQEWQPTAAPSGITFIGMPPAARSASGGSWWLRGLAVAASFIFGLTLTAAIVNLQVSVDDSGWSVGTSLWGGAAAAGPVAGTQTSSPAAAVPETPAGAQLRPVSVQQMNQTELESWLDEALTSRGLMAVSSSPTIDTLSEAQRRQVVALLADRFAQESNQTHRLLGDLVTASEIRQRQEFAATLTSLYESMEAEREDALFLLANEFGLAQVDTGQQIELANARIDYLLTQVGSQPPRDEQ